MSTISTVGARSTTAERERYARERELRTICSTGDGIGLATDGIGVSGSVGTYPTDFDVVK